MYKVDLTNYVNADATNGGDVREWAVCRYFGVERVKHDNSRYDMASDCEVGELRISIKANRFSLMSGSLCKGCDTFDDIWNRYNENVHSNIWAYVTKDWQCYFMDKEEFSKFIHNFARLDRESSKRGGGKKIKGKEESKAMLSWLEGGCA